MTQEVARSDKRSGLDGAASCLSRCEKVGVSLRKGTRRLQQQPSVLTHNLDARAIQISHGRSDTEFVRSWCWSQVCRSCKSGKNAQLRKEVCGQFESRVGGLFEKSEGRSRDTVLQSSTPISCT